MKRAFQIALIAWCLFSLSASVSWADTRPGKGDGRAENQLKRRWDEAKSFLKAGAYGDALQSLDVILRLTPDDPWAQLYHSLCELRLKSPPPFAQLAPTQLASLKERLRSEEHAQRRSSAQQKTLERTLRNEQARWDRELDVLEQQAKREEQVKHREAQVEAVQHARAERVKNRELAKQEAVQRLPVPSRLGRQTGVEAPVERAPSAPSEPKPTPSVQPVAKEVETGQPSPEIPPAPAEPAVPRGAAPAGAPARGTVELTPVVVPTTLEEAEEKEPVTPSLVGRPKPPPGAVQVHARQMSVSPDRKIAIAEGDVEVVFENAVLTCDHLTLFTDTKDAYAEGRVRLEEGTQIFRGEMVHYNFETKKGRFLQGTVFAPPWHEYGRSVEHIAEGVYEVTPGYLTSCELEPPHFKFYGRRAIVFADDRLARMRNVTFAVEQVPFFYLPWMTVADRQSPFFIIPGKKKPWGQFALMGYRYELPGPANQRGTVKLDWRRYFGWGGGVDHRFESPTLGKGLVKAYYNEEQDMTVKDPKASLPKGATQNRYRVLFRHNWQPLPDTTVITDIQKYSDINFRKDLLFREEFAEEDAPDSFVSLVKGTPDFTLTGLVRKRMNRFQTVDEAFPQLTFDVRQQRIGDTQFFSQSQLDFANLQTKRAHSDNDTDVVRMDWFQQFSYALSLFRPIEVTPKAGIRQTFYTKDIQGSTREGQRDLFSGQFSMGADASMKLFRIFPLTTNALGLNINWLRHILTPSIAYSYVHPPTVPNDLLNFATASGATSQMTFGLENKLQTKRPTGGRKGVKSADLARLVLSVPYTFRGNGNKQGGRLGDLGVDLETYPWPWLRLETDTSYPSHFMKGSRDSRITTWNLDLVIVGGHGEPQAQYAPKIQPPLGPELQSTSGTDVQAPSLKAFEPGPRGELVTLLMPQGQWYLGLGHRYSQNDKTEDVVQFDWRLSEKWEVSTFNRIDLKEVAGGQKRFNNLREYQYALRRDLHDWIAELVYRVDREYGEELYFTLTLKAYPELPIAFEDSYHQPKIGSQSSPFSPLHSQSPGS